LLTPDTFTLTPLFLNIFTRPGLIDERYPGRPTS
jgi:hypothetical protein